MKKLVKPYFYGFSNKETKAVLYLDLFYKKKQCIFAMNWKEDEDFTVSVGWLDRWKKRYGVRQLDICAENLSASEAVVQFCDKFKNVIESECLTPDQIYNCDETGLHFKTLPSKTLASLVEKAALGHKKSKERLTVLATSNSSGSHKLKLAVIGKSANPCAFKNIS